MTPPVPARGGRFGRTATPSAAAPPDSAVVASYSDADLQQFVGKRINPKTGRPFASTEEVREAMLQLVR